MREPACGRDAGFFGRRAREVGEALVADERLRFGVLEDVRDLGRRQPVVDRHVVPTGLQRREVQVHRVATVRQDRGDRVARLQPERAQRVHDLVRAGEHLAGGVLGPVGVDDREIVGIFLRVRPEAGHRSLLGCRRQGDRN